MSDTSADPGPPALRLASTGTLTHGLSVGEVLGVSTLNGARLIAGRSGLGRIVQRLNVMEVPDILSWVKPNELLLTTGYPLRNTPSRSTTWSPTWTSAAWRRWRSSWAGTWRRCPRR